MIFVFTLTFFITRIVIAFVTMHLYWKMKKSKYINASFIYSNIVNLGFIFLIKYP